MSWFTRRTSSVLAIILGLGLGLGIGTLSGGAGSASAQTSDASQCEADAASVFGRCAAMSRDVDPELCARLEQLFRDDCVEGGGDQGTCLDRCGDDASCERECVEQSYDEASRRAARRQDLIATFDSGERMTDIRQNLELTRAIKAVILDQTRSDFEDFTITYERDRPIIQPPCGDLDPQPLTLRQVTAQGLDHWETTTCSGGNTCAFPNEYDVGGWGPTMRYRLETMNATTALTYINGVGGRQLVVHLNGQLLQPGDYYVSATPCESGHECIDVYVVEDRWYPAEARFWPSWWNLQLDFQDEGIRGDFTCRHLIEPAEKLKSFWLHTIGETVSSSRCTSCHALDSKELILLHHTGFFSESDIELVPSALHPATQQLHGGAVCANCHFQFPSNTFHEERWASPTPEQNINWSEIIIANFINWPYAVCNRMVSNLPTSALREEHFHEDARLFWAVGSGEMPLGKGFLPTAPPHNYPRFLTRFDRWNKYGAACPPNLF